MVTLSGIYICPDKICETMTGFESATSQLWSGHSTQQFNLAYEFRRNITFLETKLCHGNSSYTELNRRYCLFSTISLFKFTANKLNIL